MQIEDYRASAFGAPRRTGGRHGYVAYFAAPLPRVVPLTPSTVRLLADAEAALGALAGVGRLLPNPYLLIRPYLLREAVSSTRIEGTRATILDLLDVDADSGVPSADVEEVINYIEALEWGLGQGAGLPLGARLMRGMHRRLLAGVRGRDRMPGEFRTSQNWIGPPDSTLQTATFVPPPPQELQALLSDWERYAHEHDGAPLLIRIALLHHQFETLHPFLDGNGRLGRLLIVFMLVDRGRLPAPLLYVSPYLERERDRYYAALQEVRRTGDPVPWLTLFLEAVRVQASDAVSRAQHILGLRERYRAAATTIRSGKGPALVDLICEMPIVSSRVVRERLGVSAPTALALLRQLAVAGVVEEVAAGPRGLRRYAAPALIAAITGDGPPDG